MDFKIENKIIKLQPRSNKLPIPGKVSQKSERLGIQGMNLLNSRHHGTIQDFFWISGTFWKSFSGFDFEINVTWYDKGLNQLDEGSKRFPRDERFGSFIGSLEYIPG